MLKDIADFFVSKLIPSPDFNNKNQVRDTALLVPEFYALVKKAIAKFNETYKGVEVVFVETYRSNALQLIHFNNGASKISKNGMHHYGIAVDCAFKVNGKFTYNGDYKLLRKCFQDVGLHLLGLWDMGHVQYIPVDQQTALRNAVDGAIKMFQREHGLIADGIPGPKTIAKAKEIFGV